MTLQIFLKFEIEPLLFHFAHSKKKFSCIFVKKDYHCGNGTASIFYQDPSVLVVSIHCDPEWEYPFHSGYADQRGKSKGLGTTLHIPLPPRTTWEVSYKSALEKAMEAIQSHDSQALVVSLGLGK